MLLEYIKSLGYYEDPDYEFILRELTYVLDNHCDNRDPIYDWELMKQD